ncbi:unnamed protein product, partial [Laminaria digitata]
MSDASRIKNDEEKSNAELIAELQGLRSKLARTEMTVSTGTVSAQAINDALDATPALIAYIDDRQRYRYVNATYAKWFGLSIDAMIGRTVQSVVDPGAYAVFSEAIDTAMKGEVATYPNLLELADGEARHVEARLVPQSDSTGKIIGCFLLVFDISERIVAEDALRRSEERYRSLVEICPDAVYVHRDFELVFTNPAAARMFGARDPDELVGQRLDNFIDPVDHDLARNRYERLLSGIRQEPHEFLMRRVDRSVFSARTQMVPVTWKDDAAVMIVAHDIN